VQHFSQHRLGFELAQLAFHKTSTSASLTKPLTVWNTTNCGKFLKKWKYHTTLPLS